MPAKIRLHDLAEKVRAGEPLTMFSLYDAPAAAIADAAGVDMILIGDSLGMPLLGRDDTLTVTLDEIIVFCRAVARGARRPLLIGDLPFLTYTSPQQALDSAGRIMREGGVDAVKLEGGETVVPMVEALVRFGIPVMGHLGLTPQSVHALGGFRMQGRTVEAAKRLLAEARALEAAGVFALVLEAVPREVAAAVRDALQVPVIGIGAGPDCDGQVLLYHDVLGLTFGRPAKFVRVFADVRTLSVDACRSFCEAVRERSYPQDEHSYHMTASELEVFLQNMR